MWALVVDAGLNAACTCVARSRSRRIGTDALRVPSEDRVREGDIPSPVDPLASELGPTQYKPADTYVQSQGRHPGVATVADPKRALVHALQNDLTRMLVLLERLDELLS